MATHRPVAVRLADEHHELIRDIAAALKRDPSVAERIRAVLYTATSEDAVNSPVTPLPGRALVLVEGLPEPEPEEAYEDRLTKLETALEQLTQTVTAAVNIEHRLTDLEHSVIELAVNSGIRGRQDKRYRFRVAVVDTGIRACHVSTKGYASLAAAVAGALETYPNPLPYERIEVYDAATLRNAGSGRSLGSSRRTGW